MANTQTFIGDGTTTTFYFTFPFFGTGDIKVTINDIPLTSDDFTVYPTQSPEPADTEYTGGHIETATAPANGATIKVFRDIELVRHIDYQPTAEPSADQMNQDANQCMAALNEMSDKLTNTLALASIPTLSDLLSELSTIRESFPDFLTDDDLDTLNTAVSNLNTTVTNLNTAVTALNGYDYVIALQLPTADNNYTWYRKYKSGWIEQGGILTGRQGTITLPVEMADINYIINLLGCFSGGTLPSSAEINAYAKDITTTGMFIYTNHADKLTWSVRGMAAQG